MYFVGNKSIDMDNSEIITAFYSAFSRGDANEMTKFYADNIQFEDPAFGKLNGKQAKLMWEMLISRSNGDLVIEYSNINANEKNGTAEWIATYHYGPKRRKVVNHVKANFTFDQGKITKHIDEFDFHNWASQALGLTGKLLGKTKFLRNKVQTTTNNLLDKYIDKKESSIQ